MLTVKVFEVAYKGEAKKPYLVGAFKEVITARQFVTMILGPQHHLSHFEIRENGKTVEMFLGKEALTA